jgi:hypothetical protein
MPRTHLANKFAVASVNTEPMAVEDGSYTTTVGVDETTNLLTNGFYEDEATIKRATGTLRLVYDGDNPPEFDEGDIIVLSISQPGRAEITGPPLIPARPGGPMLACNARVTSMTYPVVNPRGATKYSFDWSSQGEYTKGQTTALES